MVGKEGKQGIFEPFFIFLKRLHDGLSIKICTFAKESAKKPQRTGIIMQLRNGSPAETAQIISSKKQILYCA